MTYIANIFDLCPDIEELITDELKVLLKFREATKELKLRIHLNKKCLHATTSSYPNRRSNIDEFNSLINVMFPGISRTHWRDNSWSGSPLNNPSICLPGGFKFRTQKTNPSAWSQPRANFECEDAEHGCNPVTKIDEALTELGEKRFKSKKKPAKIRLLMNQ